LFERPEIGRWEFNPQSAIRDPQFPPSSFAVVIWI
jgi:hypothetical protein